MQLPLAVMAAWAIRAGCRPWPVSVLNMAAGTGSHRHWPISAGWAVAVVAVEPMPEVSAMRAVRQVFMARAAVVAVREPALAVRAAQGRRASFV